MTHKMELIFFSIARVTLQSRSRLTHSVHIAYELELHYNFKTIKCDSVLRSTSIGPQQSPTKHTRTLTLYP